MASQNPEPLFGSVLWYDGYRTGVGEYVGMQADPYTTNWGYPTKAFIWENVSVVSDSCPGQLGNFCGFKAANPGYVGDQISIVNGQQGGKTQPTYDILWDSHTYYQVPNVLSGYTGPGCAATCRQSYYCGNTVEGTFTINYELNETALQSMPFTNVKVTKQ